MKLLFSFILFSFSLLGFAQADITPQIAAALKKGDAAAIAQQMMPQVELTLQGQDKTVSKADAQKMLSGFFSDVAPSNFVVKHQGTSKLDDQYRIGDLTTGKGKFRVTFFMKKDGSAMLIRQLKIEPAD
jgi:hypothetical protein